MSIVNRVVDKVYVINLDTEQERMNRVHAQLLSNSIEYKRFSAIVGKKVENSKYLSSTCNRFCTDGIRGCALSHRAIWEDMILNNYQSVLILEDDIDIVPDFNEKFKSAWDHVPKDFDVLWVGCKFICEESPVGDFLTTTGITHKSEKINENILKTQGSVGAHAYILTRRCAEKFLSKTIQWHIDAEMQKWVKEDQLKSYAMSALPIQTRSDAATSSTLSEKYPKLLNSLLDRIPISKTDTMSWIIGENHYKVMGHNWNVLSLLLIFGMLFTPVRYLWVWALWIGAEFIASFDTKNTVKMGALLAVIGIAKAMWNPKKIRLFSF